MLLSFLLSGRATFFFFFGISSSHPPPPPHLPNPHKPAANYYSRVPFSRVFIYNRLITRWLFICKYYYHYFWLWIKKKFNFTFSTFVIFHHFSSAYLCTYLRFLSSNLYARIFSILAFLPLQNFLFDLALMLAILSAEILFSFFTTNCFRVAFYDHLDTPIKVSNNFNINRGLKMVLVT
jgi:hypothetical protein